MEAAELSHIGVRQLFYQLKQLYPHAPDSLVNVCLQQVNSLFTPTPYPNSCWKMQLLFLTLLYEPKG